MLFIFYFILLVNYKLNVVALKTFAIELNFLVAFCPCIALSFELSSLSLLLWQMRWKYCGIDSVYLTYLVAINAEFIIVKSICLSNYLELIWREKAANCH